MAERDRTKHELEEFSKAYARRRRLLIVCNIVGGGALLGLIVMQFTDFRGTALGISMSSNLVFGILSALPSSPRWWCSRSGAARPAISGWAGISVWMFVLTAMSASVVSPATASALLHPRI